MTALPFPEPRWQTDRTVLRPYTPADEKAFLRLWSDPVVQQLSFVENLSPTRTEQFLRRTTQAIAGGSLFFTVVEEKERREFIGHVSLNFKPPSNRDAAVGIALKGGYRGRGFGTELMHWLITHGFREFGLDRISLTVLEDNIPALKMYKKIGFIEEGRNKGINRSHGRPRDIICMSIVREEWDVQRGTKREFPLALHLVEPPNEVDYVQGNIHRPSRHSSVWVPHGHRNDLGVEHRYLAASAVLDMRSLKAELIRQKCVPL